jgi:hypothetical protein
LQAGCGRRRSVQIALQIAVSFATNRRCRSSGTLPAVWIRDAEGSGRAHMLPTLAKDVGACVIDEETTRCDLPQRRFRALVALRHRLDVIFTMTACSSLTEITHRWCGDGVTLGGCVRVGMRYSVQEHVRFSQGLTQRGNAGAVSFRISQPGMILRGQGGTPVLSL